MEEISTQQQAQEAAAQFPPQHQHKEANHQKHQAGTASLYQAHQAQKAVSTLASFPLCQPLAQLASDSTSALASLEELSAVAAEVILLEELLLTLEALSLEGLLPELSALSAEMILLPQVLTPVGNFSQVLSLHTLHLMEELSPEVLHPESSQWSEAPEAAEAAEAAEAFSTAEAAKCASSQVA